MKLLTIFTPAYNRKHTINRTYLSLSQQTCKDFQWLIIDDGSSDGTKEWVLSLAESIELKAERYDWMGRPIENLNSDSDSNHFVIEVPFADGVGMLQIEYIYKPNGGLYTGYNVAYATIKTELCVCVDSDDYMPDDAVEKISTLWRRLKDGSLKLKEPVKSYCGINGLDFDVKTKQPIGGYLPEGILESNLIELNHHGDKKQVMRTDIMRKFAPQVGFEGEKDFNPNYMQMQVFDKWPMLMLNDNLCWVEYQTGGDSMSQAIYKQYIRSPKSYSKARLMCMTLDHYNNVQTKFFICAHYVSSCIFSHDKDWLKNSPEKLLTLLAVPVAVALNLYIRYKASKN